MRKATVIALGVLVTAAVACESSETEISGGSPASSSGATAVTGSGSSGTASTGIGGGDAGSSVSSASGSASTAGSGVGGAGGSGGAGGAGGAGGSGGAADLGPGALQFIGVNSDIPEGFALVALVDLPNGTELRFTERAWNGTSEAFEIPEGTATLTLTTTVAAGTVFEVVVSPPATLAVAPDIGTVVNDDTGAWGIAGNGDNLFVYVGPDASPTFIAGIAFSSPSVWTTDADDLDGQSSMIPATLSEGAGTIITLVDDNARYTGPRSGEGTIAAYLPLIADNSRYETGNAAYSPLRGSDFSP